MLDERPGFTWDTFVRHIADSGAAVGTGIKPKRRHVFQWRDHNLVSPDDESFENDMGDE